MEKMNEQINLFDSDIDKRYQFYGHYCNDDWSTKTAMVNGVSDIVMSFSIEL
ncbi:PcfU, partial [Enterococcus faecalis]|nr:PcfU [Enterococcus faecalis]